MIIGSKSNHTFYRKLDWAANEVLENANAHQHKQPTLGTLLEEVSEYARALEGKHEHSPEHELVEIGGIVVNLLRHSGQAG